MDGIVKLFEYFIELKGKFCFYKSINKNVLYVGCLFRIFKLKIIERNLDEFIVLCFVEIIVKEDFEVFCVDEE